MSQRERFIPDSAFRKAKDTSFPVAFFTPDKTGHDRLGNILKASDSKGYIDHRGRETRAAMLLSPEGQSLLADHQDSWDALDHRLAGVYWMLPDDFAEPLDDGSTLEKWSRSGSFSNIYKWHIDGKTYIVKHGKKSPRSTEAHQQNKHLPYYHEMLLTQLLAREKKSELEHLGVQVVDFLWASGQVCGVEFIDNGGIELDYDEEAIQREQALGLIVNDFLCNPPDGYSELTEGVVFDERSDDVIKRVGDEKLFVTDLFRVK